MAVEAEEANKANNHSSQNNWKESANIARSVTKAEMMSQKTAVVANDF